MIMETIRCGLDVIRIQHNWSGARQVRRVNSGLPISPAQPVLFKIELSCQRRPEGSSVKMNARRTKTRVEFFARSKAS
jgi:hypothetical protein